MADTWIVEMKDGRRMRIPDISAVDFFGDLILYRGTPKVDQRCVARFGGAHIASYWIEDAAKDIA